MSTMPCACGCGRAFEVDPGAKRGRPRRYYNAACRARAQLHREQNRHWIKASEGELHVASAPPAKQLENAIAEMAVIAAAIRRLAIEEPDPLRGAGCECVYLDTIATLDRNFPGWSA